MDENAKAWVLPSQYNIFNVFDVNVFIVYFRVLQLPPPPSLPPPHCIAYLLEGYLVSFGSNLIYAISIIYIV
jgi:hypothetical protein